MIDQVFAALADPTRRHVYTELASNGPLTATALASDLAVTRQAVAKHLGILAEAGMASSSRRGRETQFEAVVEPLSDVQQWLSTVEGQWRMRLDGLAASLRTAERDPG